MNDNPLSRRRFLGLGALAGAGFVAASCGGNNVDGAGEASAPGDTSSPEETSAPREAEVITAASSVQPGQAVQFEESGDPAVLIHLQSGEFVAYSAICTHRGCTVSYKQQSQKLECPCHGSVFDPAQEGRPEEGPAEQPLPGIPVEEQNGNIVKA